MFKTDFLDVSLSLRDNTYEPFKKKNCKVMYIHNQSNHQKLMRKYITPLISNRLDKRSSNSIIFERNKKPYNEAHTGSGHNPIQHTDSSKSLKPQIK